MKRAQQTALNKLYYVHGLPEEDAITMQVLIYVIIYYTTMQLL